MFKLLLPVFCFIAVSLSFSISSAARLNTQCVRNASTGVIEGSNIEKPYTIASVTKVFTTHWAIARLGPRYRFSTLVHVTPIARGIYDVHLEGSQYPYFDKSSYQFLVSELNRIGITKINYLTYDEYFVYSSNIRTNPALAHGNDSQTLLEIMRDLRSDTTNINTGMKALSAKALALEGVKLPKSVTISVDDIHHKSRAEFNKSSQTVTYELKSVELDRVLKELNRNSHNFAADTVFNGISRLENYANFLTERLNVPRNEFLINNGSGYPVFINNQKIYNQASCRVVVEMMADLRNQMQKHGLEFQDIMAVAGKDSDADGKSTVTQIYGSEQTSGALIAKTGTVNNTVTLGGMVSTENENIFFHTSFEVQDTAVDRRMAYEKIREFIVSRLIRNNKKGNLDKYVAKTFMSFDKNSSLSPIMNIQNENLK